MHLKEGYHLHNGKYQLLNVIGEGGFSLTYKGLWNTEVHGPLGKIPTQAPVCIKEYFFKDYCLRNEKTNFVETNSANGKIIFEKYKEKIIKEARILAEIHHPNVVKVLEVFKQNNTVYTIMEFISGDSLKKELELSGIFKEEKLLPIIYKIGQALQYIHEKNILHLDIKPSNILMDGEIPKLIDFGISKRYDPQHQQETSTTILAASKGYASIEQYDSEGMQVFSPRPDVYSLGATMYFLLTGETPTESILRSTKGLQNPRELNPAITGNTEKVILKAMELHADDRYQSIIEMITDLGYNPERDQVQLPSRQKNEDDQTILLNPTKPQEEEPFDVDDQTQIYSIDEEQRAKARKKKFLVYLSLATILITGLLFSLFSNTPFSFQKKVGYYGENEQKYTQYYESGIRQFNNRNFSQAKEEFNLAKKYKNTKEVENYLSRIDRMVALYMATEDSIIQGNSTSIATPRQGVNPDNTDTIQENPEENITAKNEEQEKYDQFFKSGITSFNRNDFVSAKKDFETAVSYKNTTEINHYISLCKSELEKIEITNRKKLYEVIIEFSTFVVVKKKANNLVGMVDNKNWKEMVDCKYLSSEPVGENRVFEREDGFFDVYSPSGELIKEKIDTYNY